MVQVVETPAAVEETPQDAPATPEKVEQNEETAPSEVNNEPDSKE